MYLVGIDGLHNRLNLTLTESVDEVQAEALLKELEHCIGELAPGFVVVTDLTRLESLEPSANPHIQKIMDLCNAHGVSKLIRIIPDCIKNFGPTVMAHFHYDRSVPVITVSTLEDAQKRIL